MSVEMDQSIRAYPSIKDYYDASKTTSQRSVHLQNGLSNYSTLVFGDDRISVSESMMNATYRPSVEDKMMVESPSRIKSKNHRRREYLEAANRVSSVEVDRLERVMKDKLVQRSLKSSSAFQVKKAFKFFDREQSLRICIEGFTKALEFLGFQFSEIQNLALFARYDSEFEGEIIYMDFIHNAMFFRPNDDDMAARQSPDKGISHSSLAYDYEDNVKDLTLNQLKILQEAEIRAMFDKVDRDSTGAIYGSDLEQLLYSLGQRVSTSEVDTILFDLCPQREGTISFQEFYEWWCISGSQN